MRQEIRRLDAGITVAQNELLRELQIFLSASVWDFRKRWRLVGNIRKEVGKILGLISDYNDANQALMEFKRNVIFLMKSFKKFSEYMNRLEWVNYTTIDPLEIESTYRVLDHVSSEASLYLASYTSYVAALIGVVVGALLTLLVTHIP